MKCAGLPDTRGHWRVKVNWGVGGISVRGWGVSPALVNWKKCWFVR